MLVTREAGAHPYAMEELRHRAIIKQSSRNHCGAAPAVPHSVSETARERAPAGSLLLRAPQARLRTTLSIWGARARRPLLQPLHREGRGDWAGRRGKWRAVAVIRAAAVEDGRLEAAATWPAGREGRLRGLGHRACRFPACAGRLCGGTPRSCGFTRPWPPALRHRSGSPLPRSGGGVEGGGLTRRACAPRSAGWAAAHPPVRCTTLTDSEGASR